MSPNHAGPQRSLAGIATIVAMIATSLIGATGLAVASGTESASATPTDYTPYVNAFIGTGDSTTLTGNSPGSGLVGQGTPAAHVPFGMLQWGPDTDSVTNNSRHYNYADTKITGFSLHNEFGYEPQMVSFLPYAGAVSTSPGSSLASYYQTFTHSNESASPGTYAVTSASGITTSLTATTRSGIAQVAYPTGATTSLIINLQDPTGNSNGNNSVSVDPITGTVSGWVGNLSLDNSKGTSRLYFSASFDRSLATYSTFNGSTLTASGTGTTGNAVGAVLTFAASATPLAIRTAVSWVSIANAQANLAAEIPSTTTFAAVAAAAHTTWQNLLARFAITDPAALTDDLTNFYSALYRTVSAPTTFSDTNGQYFGWDGATHTVASGRVEYNGWGSWNGSRTGQMAFLATFFPAEGSDVGQSIVDSSLVDNFNHNVSQGAGFFDGDSGDYAQLPELYAFGAKSFDVNKGLGMLLQSANQATNNVVRYGNANYLGSGYVPSDTALPLSVEETQSYAQFDFATSQLASAAGQTASASQLLARSDNWRNVFDSAATTTVGSGYMWGRTKSGTYAPSFCAGCGDWTSGTRSDGTTFWEEASSAQSSYWPTYNLAALIRAQGGNSAFTARLDDFFTTLNDGTHSSRYYQGNEPDVMAPWEYDWAGKPSGTQSVIRRIITTTFLNSPGGMPGNDDWSAESTWQTWAMLGMFPEIPSVGGFALASPLFASTVITLENGKTLTITGTGAARNAPYVQSATLNGSAYSSPWVPLASIANGNNNTLGFVMGASATTWGSTPTVNAPPSFPAPTIPVSRVSTGGTSQLYRQYDLGTTRTVTGFTVNGTVSGGYTIQSSTSGDPLGSWTTIATGTGTAPSVAEYFTSPTNARYVRVLATTSAAVTPLPSFDVHGVIVPSDLAAGRTTTSSGSPCSAGEGSANALDGSDTTKWCINAAASAAWMTVDLGSPQTITNFVVKNAGLVGEPDNTNTADYKIQYSPDGTAGGTWTDLATVAGSTGRVSYVSIPQTTARYLRLYITKGTQGSGDNVARIYGFEVYGPNLSPGDLAAGKSTTSSAASCTAPEGSANALDSTDTTKWCMNATTSAGWMTVDLGSPRTVTNFTVKSAGINGESDAWNVANYKIQSSVDGTVGGTWTDLATITGNTGRISYSSTPATSTRYLRLYIIKGTQGTGDNVARIYSFEAFGPSIAAIDLLSGKTATSSATSCSGTEGPANAIDGSDTTKWCLNAAASAAWLSVDLGSARTLSTFVIKNAGINGEPDSTNTANYKIQYSATGAAGGTWTDLAAVTGNTAKISTATSTPTSLRYLRLYITKGIQGSGDNVARIYSFEAYGPPS